jgi:hypothetical protein
MSFSAACKAVPLVKSHALSLAEAVDRLIAEALTAVKTWRNEAKELGIRPSEQEQRAATFPE